MFCIEVCEDRSEASASSIKIKFRIRPIKKDPLRSLLNGGQEELCVKGD